MSEFKPREDTAAEGAPFAPRAEQPLVARGEQSPAFREDLPVPESWSKTIWEVVKPLPLSMGLMYGLMHLVMPDEAMGWRWFAQMGGFFAAMGVFQRRKGMFHSQGLLVFGALTGGAAALIAGTALFAGDKSVALMGVIFGVFGAVSLIAGFRARTLERERAARLDAERSADGPIDGALPVATLRERLQRFRTRSASGAIKRTFAGLAAVIGGTIGALLFGERLGFSDNAYVGVFLFFWAGIGGTMWYGSRITRALAREEKLECPACRRPLVGMLGSQRLLSQLEDLGRCPQCAARITVEVL